MSSAKRARIETADTYPAVDATNSVQLCFETPSAAPAALTVIVGMQDALLGLSAELLATLLPKESLSIELWKAIVAKVKPGDAGSSASHVFVTADGATSTVVAAVLPTHCSRHNSPLRPYAITALLVGASAADAAKEPTRAAVYAVLDDAAHAAGAACAIARAFPLYSMKNLQKPAAERCGLVRIGFATRTAIMPSDGTLYESCAKAADAVRLAARLVDTPPEQLTTTAFVGEAKATAARLRALGREVAVEVISGDELLTRGYGGLHGVGRAAAEPPALCVLSHVAAAATKTVALVGKGIVYDTGGLGLKPKEGMCGMKCDMGGAAGLMGAFEAAVAIGTGQTSLHCILCLAENAIGPTAFRHDDILTFLSGRTCEINNTDAEGRLVLSDGVAHATALPPRLPGLAAGGQPDLVVDMATLTGAQMIATGKKFAAIFTNDEATELAAVAAGRRTGDLVHPLPYAPEFHRAEFLSKVADCKNSVKDRNNAQSSCAGNFIGENLHPDFKGAWLHVDCAGPAFVDDRGTGYGVALVLGLLGVDGFGP